MQNKNKFAVFPVTTKLFDNVAIVRNSGYLPIEGQIISQICTKADGVWHKVNVDEITITIKVTRLLILELITHSFHFLKIIKILLKIVYFFVSESQNNVISEKNNFILI